MRALIRWLTGRSDGVAARGRLSVGSLRWAAVPSPRASAFHDANRGTLNALSFAHFTRGLAARFPGAAGRAARALAEVRELEERYPHCVVFVFVDFDPHE